eukprot:190051_1
MSVSLFIAVVSLVTMISSARHVDLKWLNCTQPENGAFITSLYFVPTVPILGETVTVTAKGMIKSETVTNQSYYTVEGKFGYLTVLDHTGPLCGNSTVVLPLHLGQITFNGLECPQVNSAWHSDLFCILMHFDQYLETTRIGHAQ